MKSVRVEKDLNESVLRNVFADMNTKLKRKKMDLAQLGNAIVEQASKPQKPSRKTVASKRP